MTDEREIRARHEEHERRMNAIRFEYGVDRIAPGWLDAHADRATLLALLRERKEESGRLRERLTVQCRKHGQSSSPYVCEECVNADFASLARDTNAAEMDLQRVRGALEDLVRKHREPGSLLYGMYVLSQCSPDVIDNNLREAEKALAALTPARPGEDRG